LRLVAIMPEDHGRVNTHAAAASTALRAGIVASNIDAKA
jgi:hypothetical protein